MVLEKIAHYLIVLLIIIINKFALANNSHTYKPHPQPPYLYSSSAVVYSVNSQQKILSKNATVVMPIASLTKLMTAVVVLQSNTPLANKVTISSEDIDYLRHTYSHLAVGTRFSRQQLLLMMLMSSENRAAAALARTTYKNKKQFIQQMNIQAKKIGMYHTVFYDATGLDQRNVANADDLVKLVKLAYKYQLIRAYSTTAGANIRIGRYYHHYVNTDALVVHHNLPILLSKTGFINESGHHLVLYTLINHRPIIIILINSANSTARVMDGLAVQHYLLNLHTK